MKAHIFEGGECIDEDNSITMSEWSIDAITKAFGEYFGPAWLKDDTGDMFSCGPMPMNDTIGLVSNNLAQAVTCSVNGGMTYLVRA